MNIDTVNKNCSIFDRENSKILGLLHQREEKRITEGRNTAVPGIN